MLAARLRFLHRESSIQARSGCKHREDARCCAEDPDALGAHSASKGQGYSCITAIAWIV